MPSSARLRRSGSSGCCGFLVLHRCGAGAARCRKHHQYGEKQCDGLFHLSFPPLFLGSRSCWACVPQPCYYHTLWVYLFQVLFLFLVVKFLVHFLFMFNKFAFIFIIMSIIAKIYNILQNFFVWFSYIDVIFCFSSTWNYMIFCNCATKLQHFICSVPKNRLAAWMTA